MAKEKFNVRVFIDHILKEKRLDAITEQIMSNDVMALLEKDAVEEESLRSLLKLSVDNENLRLLLLVIL